MDAELESLRTALREAEAQRDAYKETGLLPEEVVQLRADHDSWMRLEAVERERAEAAEHKVDEYRQEALAAAAIVNGPVWDESYGGKRCLLCRAWPLERFEQGDGITWSAHPHTAACPLARDALREEQPQDALAGEPRSWTERRCGTCGFRARLPTCGHHNWFEVTVSVAEQSGKEPNRERPNVQARPTARPSDLR